MELSVISNLNDIIRKSVEKELSSSVSDLQMDTEKFSELFGDYIPNA
jgi:hypothetical protein